MAELTRERHGGREVRNQHRDILRKLCRRPTAKERKEQREFVRMIRRVWMNRGPRYGIRLFEARKAARAETSRTY